MGSSDSSKTAPSANRFSPAVTPTACPATVRSTHQLSAPSPSTVLWSPHSVPLSSFPPSLDCAMSNDPDQYALDVKRIRRLYDDRLHRRIRRMQFNMSRLLEIGLDRRFMVDQRHDRWSVLRR